MQQGDFEALYEALEGNPVVIRYLDPPLHEFVPTEEADIEKVNLAYELTDGVKVYIPSKNEEVENSVSTQKYISTDSGENVIMEESDMKEAVEALVNINEATQTELESLPGIGPSTALKIISYYQQKLFC